jgi:hypothetical protein
MVSHSGTSIRADQLRPLNRPRRCRVTTERGVPTEIIEGKRHYPVERVQDRWQLSDEWWRTPIERHYFELVMTDGRIRTVYHDRQQGAWFEQRG